MDFDFEINKTKQILQGNFNSPAEKQVWLDKLAELERRKASYENNVKTRDAYFTGKF